MNFTKEITLQTNYMITHILKSEWEVATISILQENNEKMRKLIKEMNAESILTERGVSNSGVELEIKKLSISNLYVEKNELQLPRKSSENFSK